jgi:mRNA-degrading endonuclease RelE of RelBE toxin-antitoxin system
MSFVPATRREHADPDPDPDFELRVTGPASRQLNRLPEGTAAAIVEFMLGALTENPHRLGGQLQRELAGMHSARRGAYRIVYQIEESDRVVVVHRIEHRSTAYRSR